MNRGKTSIVQKLLALAVAAAYLGMMAYVISGVAKSASAEMARVRSRKRAGPARMGAQVGRLLPLLRRRR